MGDFNPDFSSDFLIAEPITLLKVQPSPPSTVLAPGFIGTPCDFYLDWNSDFVITPSGSIQTAVGWDWVRQRIVRRIITNPAQQLPDGTYTPADYIFDQTFGIGGGSLVDQDMNDEYIATLEQKISSGVLEDADVQSTTPPTIQYVQPNNETFWAIVSVVLNSGEPGQIALQVG